MRRFLIPVFFLGLVSWIIFGYIVWQIPPTIPPEINDNFITINFIYFFVSGWVGVTTTVGISLHFVHFLFEDTSKKKLELEESLRPRRVFRTSLRRGAIFSTALLSLGILKIYDLDNLLNSGFVIGIALLIEVYFSSR